MNTKEPLAEARVASAFLEVVDVFSDAIDGDRYLTVLLQAAEVAHVNDGALVIDDGSGTLHVAVASGDSVLALQRNGSALRRSSLAACLSHGIPVTEEFAPGDVLFEPYVGEAIRQGFRFEYLFPLRYRDRVMGALVLLDRRDVRLEPARADMTMSMATVAGTMMQYAHNASIAASLVSQLQTALDSRVLIEQAKGVLAERNGHDMDSAFRVLRTKARTERRNVVDVAREIIEQRR